MALPHSTTPIFVALEPDPPLHAEILRIKELTRALVGEQLYLEDPPHLTVYLAVFSSVSAAIAAWRPLARRRFELPVRLTGWHVFSGDSLTGGETLVCQIASDDKDCLRSLQREVLELLAPARDAAATHARFADRWEFLNSAQRLAVERSGFPYVGQGWEPHFTIASIRSADFATLWPVVEPQAIQGEFGCSRLRLYELRNNRPYAIDDLSA